MSGFRRFFLLIEYMKFIGLSFLVSMMAYTASALSPSFTGENPVTLMTQSLQQTQQTFARLGQLHRATMSDQGAQLQDMNQCNVALQELSFVVGRCSATYQAMFDSTGVFSQTDLANYCNGSCVNDTKAVMENALTYCNGLIQLDKLNDFNDAIQGIQLVCARQGSTYCWSKMTSLLSIVPGSATKQQLDQVCDSCVETLAKTAARSGSSQLSRSLQFLAPYCTKMNGEYCGKKFYLAQHVFGEIMSPTLAESSLETVCDPCVSSYLLKMNQVYTSTNSTDRLDSIKMFTNYMSIICDKDAADAFCLPKILDRQMEFMACGSDFQSGVATSCSRECVASLNGLSSSLGCCFGTAIRFLSFNVKPKGAIKRFVDETCHVDAVYDCSTKKTKATLVLRNILWSYVTNHMDKVKTAISLDLSAATGVPPERVLIEEITQSFASQSWVYQLMSNPQIKVTASLVPASTKDASTVLSTLSSSLQQGTISLSSVSQLGQESRVDPLQDVGVVANDSRVESVLNEEGPISTSSAFGGATSAGFLPALLTVALLMVTSAWM